MKKIYFFFNLLVVFCLLGCPYTTEDKFISDAKHEEIRASMTLIKEDRSRYSFVEAFQKDNRIVVYIDSSDLIDDANIFELDTQAGIVADNIEIYWQTIGKKEVPTGKDPAVVRVKIKGNEEYIFDESVSLFDGAIRRADEGAKN